MRQEKKEKKTRVLAECSRHIPELQPRHVSSWYSVAHSLCLSSPSFLSSAVRVVIGHQTHAAVGMPAMVMGGTAILRRHWRKIK